jgi:hypothetical protein
MLKAGFGPADLAKIGSAGRKKVLKLAREAEFVAGSSCILEI